MSIAIDHRTEMQSLLQAVAGHHGSVKARIGKAARRLDLTFNRAKDLWYADHRISIKADEIEKARIAAKEQVLGAVDEIANLRARVESLECVLRSLLGGEGGASGDPVACRAPE